MLGYKIPFVTEPFQSHEPFTRKFSKDEIQLIDNQIEQLRTSGAIVKAKKEKGQFISDIFIVPKSDGGVRLILNLKKLNEFIDTSHFQMEDVKTVLNILKLNNYMGKVDLRSAYHAIPVHEHFRKYLRFKWRDTLYEYTCIPFGLCTAPRLFTKVMKPVVSYLRKIGFISIIFIDDLLLVGNTFSKCLDNILNTVELLEKLGFTINYDKSVLNPIQEIEYLGFVFNTVRMTISLPERKIYAICQLIKSALAKVVISIHDCARLVGSLIAACPAFSYALLYCRQLEIEKNRYLTLCNQNYTAKMVLTREAKLDLEWWQHHLENSGKFLRPIKLIKPAIVIFTDASLSGWGAVCNEKRTRGFWNFQQKNFHINVLELLAVEFGLFCFCSSAVNTHVLLRVDNTTAIAYINRYGGCHSTVLQDIAKRIWKWCESRDILLTASYISSHENFIADQESRAKTDDSEWSLNNETYSCICKKFFSPSIDLFASYLTNKCSEYVSWHPDPLCSAVDAFTIDWLENFYAFPPFCLISKVVDKIIREKTRGIIVVPSWSSQPWYPIFKSICISEILVFGPSIDLLYSPFSREPHPLHRTLRLEVAIVSGSRLDEED